jgi:Ca2+-binding RTX toxin-like protein
VNMIVVVLCDGNDKATIGSSVTKPTIVDGGEGDDQLNGGKGPNVLIGGSGNDMLVGGTGKDIMIGGAGSDRLVGNGGDDLLIGTRTAFDTNYTALEALSAEWASTRTFAARVANINGTADPTSPNFLARKNGDFFLTATGANVTVFDDGARDTITGSAGSDWYFAKTSGINIDFLTDFKKGADLLTPLA